MLERKGSPLTVKYSGWRSAGNKAPLSNLQKGAIQAVAKTNMGAIAEFNQALGKTMEKTIEDRIAAGGGMKQIKQDLIPIIKEQFGENGIVTIDRIGQIVPYIEVGPDGTLRRAEKTITRPYSTNTKAYADMLSRTATHSAYEKGRVEGYKSQGVEQLRFVGPNDPPRVRAEHAAVLGTVFDVGSIEEEYFMELLSEPNCRHRTIPFMNNPKYDTPQSSFDAMKEKIGVYYDEDAGKWTYDKNVAE